MTPTKDGDTQSVEPSSPASPGEQQEKDEEEETTRPETRPKKPSRRRRRRRMLTGVSRQRRAANARERQRVQGVNEAFSSLKSVIPVLKPENVSKTETLHLAAKWIAHLTTVLIQDDRLQLNQCQRSEIGGPGARNVLSSSLQEKLDELLNFDLEDFELILRVENCNDRTNATSTDTVKSDLHCLHLAQSSVPGLTTTCRNRDITAQKDIVNTDAAGGSAMYEGFCCTRLFSPPKECSQLKQDRFTCLSEAHLTDVTNLSRKFQNGKLYSTQSEVSTDYNMQPAHTRKNTPCLFSQTGM